MALNVRVSRFSLFSLPLRLCGVAAPSALLAPSWTCACLFSPMAVDFGNDCILVVCQDHCVRRFALTKRELRAAVLALPRPRAFLFTSPVAWCAPRYSALTQLALTLNSTQTLSLLRRWPNRDFVAPWICVQDAHKVGRRAPRGTPPALPKSHHHLLPWPMIPPLGFRSLSVSNVLLAGTHAFQLAGRFARVSWPASCQGAARRLVSLHSLWTSFSPRSLVSVWNTPLLFHGFRSCSGLH